MADVQIVAGGTVAAPLAYTVPGSQEIVLKALFATFDGSGAAGSFLPCIRVVAPGGKVVGEYVTDSAVAAGSSAEVSFAPFLRAFGAGAGAGGGTTTTIADIAFVAAGAAAEGSGVTTLTVNTPAGLAFHDLLIVVFGFEGVAAGSGPWISDAIPHFGWYRVLYQAPVGGTGTGLEIWAAIWEVGSSTPWDFAASSTVVAREVAYRNIDDSIVPSSYTHASSAVAGDNPVAPTVTTTTPKSWVVPVVGQALAAGSFVYPAGYTRRFDSARGGASGNAEIAEGDSPLVAPGASGTVTITASSAGGTARGATATIVVPPLVTTTASTSTLIGLTVYTPGADGTIGTSNSASLVAVDSAHAVVTFAAPDSGDVLFRLGALASVNNMSNALHFGLLDGSTSKGESQVGFGGGVGNPNPGALRLHAELEVTGLTPGTVYGYKFAYRVDGAATTVTVSGGPTFGPLTIEAWVAP